MMRLAGFLRRLWPDSLASRTLLVMLGGLTLLHIGSVTVHERALHGVEVAALEMRHVDRILAAGALARGRSEPERDAAVHALSLPGLQLHWDRNPPGTSEPSPEFEDMLVRLGSNARLGWSADGAAGQILLGAVPVGAEAGAGEGWIVFSMEQRAHPRLTIDKGGLLSMLAMALGIGLVAVPVVRWMTRPLQRLAQAADLVGRDPRPIILATDGPLEVRHAAAAFNAMQARIARLIEDRTEALAAMSHDLRTPLARLRLRAGFLDESEDRARIEADIAEMEAMVSRTLEYFREGRDSEPSVPTDLAAILQTLADEAADAGCDVTYEGPAHAVLSLRRLAAKRAISNLMNNAIQHGAPPVVIRLDERPDTVLVDVSDAGPGIPAAERMRALAPFTRLDPARSGQGVGLGLTTAARFVEAEGGALALHDAPGGGLQVHLVLPRKPKTQAVDVG